MINNFLKIAFRCLLKRKAFAWINISLLAVGMAIYLLGTLYIKTRQGYESLQEKVNLVCRMVPDLKYPGPITSNPIIPLFNSAVVQKESPAVVEACEPAGALKPVFRSQVPAYRIEEGRRGRRLASLRQILPMPGRPEGTNS